MFSGYLALGLEWLGWDVEREAQQAAGRSDLKVRWNGRSEVALIKVKIWGRNDFRDVQPQIEDDWTRDVRAGAVVQVTDAELPHWPEDYRSHCLAGVRCEEVPTEGSPIRARFACTSTMSDGLLRLPRRI